MSLVAFAIAVGFTVAVDRAQIKVVFIEGSEHALTPDELVTTIGGRQGRPGTPGGPAPRDFVTSRTDGPAFLSWRYDRPVAIVRIAQRFLQPPDPAGAMRAFSLQYRSAAGAWREALHGAWSRETLNEPHAFALPPGIEAMEWRVTALEGGTSNRVVIGYLSPAQPAPLLLESVVQSVPVDVLLLLSCWIPAVIIALMYKERAGPILLVGGALSLIVVVNVVVFGIFHAPVLWSADSVGYVMWPPSAFRMPGLNLIYAGLLEAFDFSTIHGLQVNLVLLSYLGALACLVRRTGRYWPFIPWTVLPLLWGPMVIHASNVMSEAWFISAVLMCLSGVIGLVLGGGYKTAAWAALGLLLAVASKGVGAILLAPAVLVYRFIPGSPVRRMKLLAVTVAPALAGYLLMSAYGYTLYGRFSPSVASGPALAQHVAWMLDAEDLPPEHRETGRRAVAELRELYAGMPPLSEPARYVDFTLERAGPALYGILVKRFDNDTISKDLGQKALRRFDATSGARDELFDSWAKAAIARDPLRYIAHVALHFWGNWYYSLQYYFYLGHSRWDLFMLAYRGTPTELPPAYLAYFQDWKQRHNRDHAFAALDYRLLDNPCSQSAQGVAQLLLAAALMLSFLYLIPVKYPAVIAAMIVWALFENAYTAGQALFSVAAPRYGEMLIPSVPLLLGLMFIAVAHAARRMGLAEAAGRLARVIPGSFVARAQTEDEVIARQTINTSRNLPQRLALRAGKFLFWMLAVLTVCTLVLETGIWTRQVSYQGPFAAAGQGRALYLPIQVPEVLSCCFEMRNDNAARWDRSDLVLWIDGLEMGPAHALHSVISSGESTAFSHWGEAVIFSLPRGIENTSATHATVRYSIRARADAWLVCALATLGLGLLLYGRGFAGKAVRLRRSWNTSPARIRKATPATAPPARKDNGS